MRVVRGHLRGQTVSISDCIDTWKQVYGVIELAVTAWPVWAPLALAMARAHGMETSRLCIARKRVGDRRCQPFGYLIALSGISLLEARQLRSADLSPPSRPASE